MKEEIIYFGGTILTMEGELHPDALLTVGDTIQGLGTVAELSTLAPHATMVNLEGHCLMPAFLDSHSHFTAVAATLSFCPLGAVTSFEELVDTLQAFQREKNMDKHQWLIGTGYDHSRFAEGAHPTCETLDAAFPDTPVRLSHVSSHMGVVNSAAMAILHIDKDTPDPQGGKLGRCSDGKTPNGYLEETAFTQLSASLPTASLEESIQNLKRAEALYFSHGITFAQDGITTPQRHQLLSSAPLTIDVLGYADMACASELIHKEGIGGYKIFLDGSPQGRTAWMSTPYLGGEDYYGYPIFTDEEVTAFVTRALTDRRQILAHCNGDAAAQQYISATKRAVAETGIDPATIRPVMIHAQLVRHEQLEEMPSLGMIPSFFAAHLWHWGDVHVDNFGLERANHISPLKWAQELGLPFTLHQDSPVIAPDMIESIWCAVNRITRKGRVLGEELKITPLEALKAITLSAAHQYFLEKERGSLALGKKADLVMLSADPTAVAPEEIRNITVLQTIKNGTIVYEKERKL